MLYIQYTYSYFINNHEFLDNWLFARVAAILYCIGILFGSTETSRSVMRFNNTQSYRFTITFQLYKLFTVHIIIRINIILFYPVRTMSHSRNGGCVRWARSDWFSGTLFYARDVYSHYNMFLVYYILYVHII